VCACNGAHLRAGEYVIIFLAFYDFHLIACSGKRTSCSISRGVCRTPCTPGVYAPGWYLPLYFTLAYNRGVTRGIAGHDAPDVAITGRRAPKCPSNVASTAINTVHSLPKDFRFEHRGAKLVSCPGRHLTMVRPFFRHIYESLKNRDERTLLTHLKDNSQQNLTRFFIALRISFSEIFFSSFMMVSGSVSLILSSSNNILRETDWSCCRNTAKQYFSMTYTCEKMPTNVSYQIHFCNAIWKSSMLAIKFENKSLFGPS